MLTAEKYHAMTQAMHDLTSILETETKALRRGHFQTSVDVHNNKMSAAMAFQDKLASLRTDLKSLAALPEAHRKDMAQRYKHLSRAAEANLRALKDMQSASDRLSRLVVGTLRQAVLDKNPLPARNQPLCVRFNQTI